MKRRIPRRAFIGGAAGAGALAVGGSTWAILAARDETTSPASNRPTATSPASPVGTPSPTATLPPPPPGGRQVIVAPAGLDLDTFDAQLSGKSSVVEVLGRTHSRLMQWVDPEGVWELQGDLAESWESQDPLTYTFRINPKAKWHQKAPLNGRAVTAADVVGHFRRSIEIAAAGKAPLAQRYHELAVVDSVQSRGAGLVQFKLKQPDEFFLDTLAGEFALIQAPEAVSSFEGEWKKLDSDHVIGSGPWTFDWADDGVKFKAARGGHREARLDELFVTEPHDNAQRFIDGALDEVIAFDRREAALIRSHFMTAPPGGFEPRDVERAIALNQVNEYQRPARELVMSTFNVGAPPWNNPKLIAAISGALNRHELAKRLFGDRARPAQPVPLPGGTVHVSGERLKFVPGYRHLEGAYQVSPELRQMWEAAGGPGLGAIVVDFPSVFDPLYSASSIVIDMLNQALGPQFRPAVETYTTISQRVIDGYYGAGRSAFWFGWGPPMTSPSAQRYLAEMYAPDSPGQRASRGGGFPGGDPATIFDSGFFGIVPWVWPSTDVFRRPGSFGSEPSPFWQQHQDFKRSNA